jgi:hypothetical protein
MSEYQPEIGQAVFGQPSHKYKVSDLLIAALMSIQDELARVWWNNKQVQIIDPFANTGAGYKNSTFEVQAYSWGEEEQDFCFWYKPKDIKICWYKYLGRGMSCNKNLSPKEIDTLLKECLKALRKEEKKYD